MRFSPLFLYAKQKVGKDQLNNDIFENALLGESVGRFSSWTVQEIALDKREVTVNNRKIITRASKSSLLLAEKVKLDSLYYGITEIKGDDHSRWRILIVNRYGSDEIEN